MLRDPEALEDERRPRLVAGSAGGSSAAAIADSVDVDPVAVTAELLARLRAGDDLVDGVRWLCIVRSDRRPATAEQLRQAIEAVAAQDGVDVDQVRTGIARALAAEGRNLEAWEASLRVAGPLLGRHAGIPLRTARGQHPAAVRPTLVMPAACRGGAAPRRPTARGLFHTSDEAEGLPVAQDRP